MASFKELPDDELNRLSDDELVAYIVAARKAGHDDAAVAAAQILALGYEDRILGFFYSKLGSKGPPVVEELAERTIFDAIASAANFAGESVKEFSGWIFQIAWRRRADYLRTGRVKEQPLEIKVQDGEVIEFEGESADPTIAIDLVSIWNQAYSKLSEPHKMVIVCVRLQFLPHRKAAEAVNGHFGDELNDPMTEDNVAKINSRFGEDLDELLDEADDPSPEDVDDD